MLVVILHVVIQGPELPRCGSSIPGAPLAPSGGAAESVENHAGWLMARPVSDAPTQGQEGLGVHP